MIGTSEPDVSDLSKRVTRQHSGNFKSSFPNKPVSRFSPG